jgi:hypothetical protein
MVGYWGSPFARLDIKQPKTRNTNGTQCCWKCGAAGMVTGISAPIGFIQKMSVI